MHWWVVGIILLVVILALVPRLRRRGPDHYMWRSQRRLATAGQLMDQVIAGRFGRGELIDIEAKLFDMARAQRREKPPYPEDGGNAHRNAYATLIEFDRWLVRDLRTTGGENLDHIIAEYEAFMTNSEASMHADRRAIEDVYRSLGLKVPNHRPW